MLFLKCWGAEIFESSNLEVNLRQVFTNFNQGGAQGCMVDVTFLLTLIMLKALQAHLLKTVLY